MAEFQLEMPGFVLRGWCEKHREHVWLRANAASARLWLNGSSGVKARQGAGFWTIAAANMGMLSDGERGGRI